MPDTYDNYLSNPNSVPALTRAICATYPETVFGVPIGPVVSGPALRALLDALANLETRVTALEA